MGMADDEKKLLEKEGKTKTSNVMLVFYMAAFFGLLVFDSVKPIKYPWGLIFEAMLLGAALGVKPERIADIFAGFFGRGKG
jgi:dolichyl-phosphate-mannose--protein O-mannosyl transferase